MAVKSVIGQECHRSRVSSVKSVINDSGAQIHHIRYKYIYLYLICSRIIPHNPKNLNDQ
jgi:hypothetical protein